MKKVNLIIVASLGLILFSCGEINDKVETKETINMTTPTEVEQKVIVPIINIDSITNIISLKRQMIEDSLKEPITIYTSELREKIKQKWSKIDYYIQDNNVVRIKTYAHPTISTRTEEFYLENNKLILAVIEDHGEGDDKKPKEELDKLYFFNNGEVIKEVKARGTQEFTIRNSDGEELLSEVQEYLDIYSKNN